MKQSPSLSGPTLLRLAFAGVAIMVMISSCESCNKKTGGNEKAPDIAVKTEFSTDPPLAKEVFLQQDGDSKTSMLVIARFDPRDTKRFDKNMFAINLENEKVVLRDDGNGGDEKGGDGLFTARVNTDVAEVQKELESGNKNQESSTTIFINRSPVKIPVRPIDIKGLGDGKPVKVFPAPKSITPPELKDHSLMITDLGVIEDPTRTITNPCTGAGNPNGAWTFGFLMRQLASPNPGAIASDADVSTFVMNWMNKWMGPQLINNDNVPPRTNMMTTVINPWLARSAAGGAPAGQLDMKFAPFRLLAIVNRIDLRGNSGYSVSNGGEGRFVFGVLNSSCDPLPFTVIFEYGINKTDCASLHAYAQQWYDLKNLTPGTTAYNDALQAITDQFTLCGTNPAKPNQSSLNQLRSNERAIGSPWQLREFNLAASGQMDEKTTTREPAEKFNAQVANPDVQVLADFANTNEIAIKDNTFDIPLTWGGMDFLGGKADTDPGEFWNGTSTSGTPTFINSDTVRHDLSLNTCSGCHSGETSTGFTHISPAPFGTPPVLSGFLIGDGASGPFIVSDPANRPSGSPIQWGFNDLQRRADDLQSLIDTPCRSIFHLVNLLTFKPLHFTH